MLFRSARSPANLGWSRPSRSPPTVPKAPPGSPLHSGPGDLVLASSPGRPRLFSATTTGPPWPPSMLSDATSAPRPRVSSAGRLAVLRRCGPVRWLPHHRAAMPRTPRHHFVVATAAVCGLRRQYMVIGDQLVRLFLSPLSFSYSLLTLPSARVFPAWVHCCSGLFSVIQDRT